MKYFHSLCSALLLVQLLLLLLLSSVSAQREAPNEELAQQLSFPSTSTTSTTTNREEAAIEEVASYLRSSSLLRGTESDTDTNDRSLLLGGTDAEVGIYTWFVELLAVNSAGRNARPCAGVLISGNTIVTLANCLYDSTGEPADPSHSQAWIKRKFTVTEGKGIHRHWDILRPHPDHMYPNVTNNIAVVKLGGVPLFPERDVQNINSNAAIPEPNQKVYVMGYGTPYNNITELQNATFNIVPEGSGGCDTSFTNATEQFICVDTTGTGKDLCEEQGDAGAPMWTRDNTLHGLYAFGGNCGGPQTSDAVFVRTSAFHAFIVATACEISNARCAESCGILGVAANSASAAASLFGRVKDQATNLWSNMFGT